MNSLIYVVAVTCILTVADCTSQTNAAEMDAKFEGYENECAGQFNVSLDDVRKSWKPQTDIPATDEIKCYDKCIVEKIGIIAADGTFNDNVAIEAFSNGHKEKFDMAIKAITKCKPLGEGKNTCSSVHKVLQCIVKEIMNVGISETK